MGKLIQIDFTKPLPFDIGSWLLSEWPLSSDYYGIMNNAINHGQTTSFEITAKWEYIKIEGITKSESGYDYLVIYKNGSEIKNFRSQPQNTPISWEYSTFDGSECTLKFTYRKDGSGTTAPDAFLIYGMTVQTADNSIKQSETRYALRCADGFIYSVDDTMTLIKIAETLEELNKETWETLGAKTPDLMNIRNEITGPAPKLLRYDTDVNNNHLVVKNICLYPPSLIKGTKSYDFSMSYITGIGDFLINQTQSDSDILKFMISVDEGVTWIAWRNGSWYATSELTDQVILENGMTAGEMEGLPEESKVVLFSTRKMRLAFILKPGSLTSELKLNKYECKYVL